MKANPTQAAALAADLLERLAADLRIHSYDDPDGRARIGAFFDLLMNGVTAELGAEQLQHLQRLGVPRALVGGDTTER